MSDATSVWTKNLYKNEVRIAFSDFTVYKLLPRTPQKLFRNHNKPYNHCTKCNENSISNFG